MSYRITPPRENKVKTNISANFSTRIIPKGKTGSANARTPFHKIAPLGISFAAAPADALAQARTIGEINPYSPNSLMVRDSVITALEDNAIKSLGVGEAKVLKAAILAFTAENAQEQTQPRLRVTLDTVDYARKCGVEIEARQMNTPEDQATENKRADTDAHNFLAKLRRNLHNVRINAAFSWTEQVKGRTESFSEVSFISAYRVSRKSITIEFSLAAAEYLVKRPLRKEPDALFLVDERRPEAYAIGVYLNQHYSIDANVERGTECILSIPKILEVTAIPTIEEVRKSKSKRTWQDQIKERFERALDELTRVGFLTTWAYSYKKQQLLTDAEAAAISSYEEYTELYLYYEIANYPLHGERVKEIKEKKEEKKAKQSNSKRGRKRKADGGE